MDELEDIKRRKLDQLRRQQEEAIINQAEEQAQAQQQIEQLELIVKQVLSKEALIRYGNIKVAHPEKAIQVLVVIAQLIQQQNIQKLTDEQFKEILKKLTPKKREFKIKRR